MSDDEKFGVALVGLAVVVLTCLLSRVSWSGSPVALGRILLGLAGAGVVLRFAAGRPGGRAARMTSGRMVAGHAHGPSATIARHEAGHAAAARALGGRVVSATADRHGGYVHAVIPCGPRAAVTFWLAGRRAAGTGAGCSADDALIRAELRAVPRAERGQLRRDADRDARRIVNQHRGQIRRDAGLLEREGSL